MVFKRKPLLIQHATYAFSVNEPIGERDCAVYMFTAFSNNSFSKSSTGVSGYKNIPTGTTCIIGTHAGRELMIMILIQLFYIIHVTKLMKYNHI